MLRTPATRTLLIAFVGLCCSTVPTAAQDKKPGKNYDVVKKWVSEVIGHGGRIDKNLGEYDSCEKASAASHQWSKENTKDLRLTRERKVEYKVFPPVRGKLFAHFVGRKQYAKVFHLRGKFQLTGLRSVITTVFVIAYSNLVAWALGVFD